MRYWKRLNPDKTTLAVESYSHSLDIEGAIEISEQEFNDYLASLPATESQPPRDLATEIDELKARLNKAGVV